MSKIYKIYLLHGSNNTTNLNKDIKFHQKNLKISTIGRKQRQCSCPLLRTLSINPAFQGKGIAKSVMLQLPNWVKMHFPETNEIAFGVNVRNKNAYELYLKTGYSDSGNIYEGKKGPQNLMFRTLP